MSATPTFTGLHAVVLHRTGDTTQRLGRQLTVLGLRYEVQWLSLRASDPSPDLVLVDADEGWSELLPWGPGRNPVPVVALLGSEAPGRIAWALDQGAQAIIAKPVVASAVFPALVMATRFHADACRTAAHIADLEERIRLRPLVLRAVEAIMEKRHCDEAAAYRGLQKAAMRHRLPLEQVAAALLSGRDVASEAG